MSDGYLDFPGLGWSSHLIVPSNDIFASEANCQINGISPDELMRSRLIPEINKETYVKVQDDKQSIKLISLNGIVLCLQAGQTRCCFGTGLRTNHRDRRLCDQQDGRTAARDGLRRTAIELADARNFSKQAIDLIDRNLFERSAAIRWWATDKFFWKALSDPSEENLQAACRRLRDINSSYAMYRNLVLSSRMGANPGRLQSRTSA